MMRPLLAVLLALQARAELKPVFQKFDKITVACSIETEVKASNGKDSKYKLELELSSEVEKAEGETAVFDCGVSSLKISGTLDGRAVDYEWTKRGTERGNKVAAIQKGLEKGWKVTAGKKGISVNDEAEEFCDVLPIFNPAVLLGFCAPMPYGAAEVGKPWEGTHAFPFYRGFRVKYVTRLNHVGKDGVARLSSQLTFSSAEVEVPVDGGINVKGEGDASMEYDVKAGRPVRGATSLKLASLMGGLRREVTQLVEFEVKR